MASLLVLALAAFGAFLNEPDIVASHEARVALPARQMAESGWPWAARAVAVPPVKLRPGVVRLAPDWDAPPIAVNPWLVPVMNGQIRLQKPPLPYWAAALCFRLFGGFSETALRIVPAMFGALGVLLIYDVGRLLFGRRAGWLAGLVWASTYAVSDEYRKAMADPYLASFTLVCIWSWIRAAQKNPRAASRDGAQPASRLGDSKALLVTFYLSFALALLAKGPPAFVSILLPLALYHLLVRRGWPGPARGHLAGLLVLLLVALPWPAYVFAKIPHALELWRYESVGELTDNTENARPFWFYLPQLLFLSLPWTLMAALGVVRQLARGRDVFDAWMRRRLLQTPASPASPARARRDIRHFFPLAWWTLLVVFFSFVHLKKNQYLLPALPGQTLLIAQGFTLLLARNRRLRFKGAPAILLFVQTLIGIIFAVAILVLLIVSHGLSASALGLALLALGMSLLPMWLIVKQRQRVWPVVQSAAFAVMIVVFGRVYFAPHEDQRSARKVAAELLDLSRQPGETLLASALPEEVAVYLPLGMSCSERAKHVLVILDDQHGVHLRRSKSAAVIPTPNLKSAVPDARVREIRRVPIRSAPGDARWKVWELTVDRSILTLGPGAEEVR